MMAQYCPKTILSINTNSRQLRFIKLLGAQYCPKTIQSIYHEYKKMVVKKLWGWHCIVVNYQLIIITE